MISKQYPYVNDYLNSHDLSALKCIDIVKRSYIGITSGSEGVNGHFRKVGSSTYDGLGAFLRREQQPEVECSSL